jgi:3'-phosphoadenosine 5'-phosphosulfate sulfotransferase (PAPS reductase)/FAD synthetase
MNALMNAPTMTQPEPSEIASSPNLDDYSKIIVAFSGGKDSVACVLALLELGVAKDRIELWHHDVDGREGSDLMDWPITRDYCRAFAEALGLPIYYSWRAGGFEGEMLRENSRTQQTRWEQPGGTLGAAGGKRGTVSTRRKFPQVAASLSVRWCSSSLKIDVCSMAIINQRRFRNTKTLVVTGERAQESKARAKYKVFEPHRADRRQGRNKRHVDVWRAVHGWTEVEVWAALERWRINPHPCYQLGFSRCSCMPCIFGNNDQWATVQALDPDRFSKLAAYEADFGVTLKRKHSLPVLAAKGTSYKLDAKARALGMGRKYDAPIFVEVWTLPSGAYGESCGPT